MSTVHCEKFNPLERKVSQILRGLLIGIDIRILYKSLRYWKKRLHKRFREWSTPNGEWHEDESCHECWAFIADNSFRLPTYKMFHECFCFCNESWYFCSRMKSCIALKTNRICVSKIGHFRQMLQSVADENCPIAQAIISSSYFARFKASFEGNYIITFIFFTFSCLPYNKIHDISYRSFSDYFNEALKLDCKSRTKGLQHRRIR